MVLSLLSDGYHLVLNGHHFSSTTEQQQTRFYVARSGAVPVTALPVAMVAETLGVVG